MLTYSISVYGRRNVAPSVTQYDFVEFIKGGRVDHRLRKRSTGDSHELEHGTSTSMMGKHRGLRTHKTDVLDSISISYEGTRKILADSEHRGPFYVPHHVTVCTLPSNVALLEKLHDLHDDVTIQNPAVV